MTPSKADLADSKSATASSNKPRFAIIPGNGCTPISECNWYLTVHTALLKRGYASVLDDFPDPYEAKERIWLPFMEKQLKCDDKTYLIGHSSGAEAIMRYLETHRAPGVFLVSACWTDLDMDSERVSGYYDREWKWEAIKANAGFIVQFASTDDPFIPFKSEQQYVAQQLSSDFRVYKKKGHFMSDEFPELLDVIEEKLKEVAASAKAKSSSELKASSSADSSAAAGAESNAKDAGSAGASSSAEAAGSVTASTSTESAVSNSTT